MSYDNMRSAILQGFVAGAFFPQEKVAWENMAFTPPTDAPWASVFLILVDMGVATLGPDGQDRCDVMLQVDLNMALGDGDGAATALFDDLRETFSAGARFTYQGTTAIVRSCKRANGFSVGSNWRVPVTITFYSHINR